MDYLMLLGATVLLAVNFSINKAYQKLNGSSPKSVFAFNSLLGLFTAIIFFAFSGFKFEFSLFSFIMAALMNTFVMCYNLFGFKLLKNGSMALYTLFLMTGGMTLPYLFGLIFLNEPFSWLKTVGLIIILSGVVLSNLGTKKINVSILLMCVAVFFLNGLTSITSKLHQINDTFFCENTTQFVILGGLFNFLISGILFLATKKENVDQLQDDKKTKLISVILTVASAIISGVSSILQLLGAAKLPATLLYPFITGGTIIFSSIAGVLIFKDKISKKLIISVILCLMGTLLFL